MVHEAVANVVSAPPTLSAALRAHAVDRRDQPALVDGEETLTYRELAELVAELTGRLARLGATPGERVAILGRNSIEWVAAFLACLDLGVTAVPLNDRLSPLELTEQISRVEPRLVLADEAMLGTAAEAADAAGAVLRELARASATGASIWHEPGSHPASPVPPADAQALIAFTSGSTGAPKGAVITHGALAHAARAGSSAVGTTEADRTLVMVPLFHNTGFADQLAQVLMVGGTVELLSAFSLGAAQRALVRRPASYLIAVPGILRLLAQSEDGDAVFSACRIACYGGSPMPESWIRDMEARWPGLGLFNVYGLTEYTSVSHCLHPRDLADHGDSVGRPVAGAEQLVVDEQGQAVGAGEPGMILVAGPSRMSGYWRAPEQTRDALRGRWVVTGDTGSVSGDGFLRLAGRAAELINRGGEKVSPLQVEAAINLEPGVVEARVIGVPHSVFGERVVAFVAVDPAVGLDEEAARQNLRARIADYAVPERFFVVDAMPRTAAGKVDRLELKRHATAAYGEGVAS
jgi:long-chain acyl-CoA synthetase